MTTAISAFARNDGEAESGERRSLARRPMSQVRNDTEARGAEPGPTMRNVLVLSISLVGVAFVVVYAVFTAG